MSPGKSRKRSECTCRDIARAPVAERSGSKTAKDAVKEPTFANGPESTLEQCYIFTERENHNESYITGG